MKKVQIDIARSGNITHAHVMLLSSEGGIRCAHGSARRHPNDDDVPFIGTLQAVTRAVTDGVAAHQFTVAEAQQFIAAICGKQDAPRAERAPLTLEGLLQQLRAAGRRQI